MHPLFPYELRKGQADILKLVSETIEKHSHLVLESGTGSGKTVCALVPSLEFALQHRKKVLYLTRTNSQQRQVMLELREICKKERVFGLSLQGRHNLCPLTKEIEDFARSDTGELLKLCSDRKRATLNALGGKEEKNTCRYFANFCVHDTSHIREFAERELPTAEELTSYCENFGICPYEANKSLLESAVVVTAPYIYFFEPFLRRKLLEWMLCDVQDLVLVVDEAHNLPEYARELMSVELSVTTLRRAKDEAEKGDLRILEDVKISDLCSFLESLLRKLAEEYIIEDDGLIPPNELEAEIMSYLKITSRRMEQGINELITHGEIIREMRRKEGKLPRSYIYSLGSFLLFWHHLESESYVKLVKGNENPKLEAYCLDPSLATLAILDVFASIHMSGTLSPLDEYKDSIGLPSETLMVNMPSPFPAENRAVYYAKDVSTRYEDIAKDNSIIEKLEEYTVLICNSFNKNTILFFPSFRLLERFITDGVHKRLKRSVYIEEQGMRTSDLMDYVERFKVQKNSVLFAVVGGRVSEGLDFPSEELEVAVLVGIPYPKPTAKQKALQHYYDVKFSRGWEYTVHAPTTRRMLQSIGRLIRNESDRGVAVILDKRAVHFKGHIKMKESENLIEDLRAFFEQ